MKKIDFKKLLPHLIAITIFLLVAIVYCKPALEGKVVYQPDVQGWRGMSQQSMEFHEKYGFYPLWVKSMFSGMPGYQIAFDAKTSISLGYVDRVFTLGLPKPISFFFLACICFYFFCIVSGANAWVSIMGALAYAYSSFDSIIVAVGHNTQMSSIAYAPAVLAGLLLIYQKKYWFGFALTALFSSLLIGQNHIQIVYYTLIIAAFFTIAYLINSYRTHNFITALKGAGIALGAGILGLATCAVTLIPTSEYAKESSRGGRSELTTIKDPENKTKGGLDKTAAFRWSYGFGETFTFMIPGMYGGGNMGKQYGSSSKFVNRLTEAGVPEDNAIQTENGYSYWGGQPSTSGPIYLGAIICFLFIFGIFYLQTWHKWWILGASIFGVLLAWGSNLKEINYFLFDLLPFYNKFRAVTMSLVIPQFCFAVLAVLSLSKLLHETDWTVAWKKLRLSVIVTSGILVLLCGFYLTAGYSGERDKDLRDQFKQMMLQQVPAGQQPQAQILQQAEDFSREMIAALRSDRKDLMGSDLMKTMLLIAAAVVLLALFIKRKIKPAMFIAGLILLSGFDLISVDRKYLNAESFIEDSDFESAFLPNEADQQIMRDPDHENFRVLDQTAGNPFMDSRASYHHNSVGGYHAALLGLYEDLIQNQLMKGNMRVYNMLNTKYFIVDNPATRKPVAQLNPEAYGKCWLVKGIKLVNNANEEMFALDSTDLKDTAIIEKSFQTRISQIPARDSSATIKLVKDLNDKISYTYNSATPQFAVFSEVYYPLGWNAYVDGKKSDYVKVNYVLRGMSLPTGKHEVEFRLEPKSFNTGRTITIISTILVILSIIAAIILYFRGRNKPDAHVL
ncbi:MAG: YfhO family protein [Ginsengibacter sp.]